MWAQDQAQERASALAPWARSPSIRGTPLADHFRIGRSIFVRLPPIHGVRDEQGRLRTDPREILWRSREAVWATTLPAPECGQTVLNAYFEHRPWLENIGLPTWDGLANVVVQPAGSAPGHDGIPYETFHHGIMFVSCPIGQAFYAAQTANTAIERVLGPSIDILVWILKGKGGERPSDMRPLQVPACFRRLFGAALASVVGPAVEPHMCNDQAAKAGGSCGPNIRRAYQHLEAELHNPRSAGSLWFNMLGDSQDSMVRSSNNTWRNAKNCLQQAGQLGPSPGRPPSCLLTKDKHPNGSPSGGSKRCSLAVTLLNGYSEASGSCGEQIGHSSGPNTWEPSDAY